jgi:hypothetical protein
MILERAAVYVLVVVCMFQSFRPARMSRSQSWKSIDLRIGCLRVQASTCTNLVQLKGRSDGNYEGLPSDQTRILPLNCEERRGKRLKICVTGADCIAAWLDEGSDSWSISRAHSSD